ncbi:hypothetical protein [Sphingobium chungbukense]|uniref:DUF3847 domain-containing protein n=1 Tax=Sphingobium chungbukense TaxID=56193 RepID=A0A0M3AT45_9SPHN|nr:hypothetical protein [Sphingobium chungbukense]KKW93030.1 hypothetical protein YP76_05955 [Sphingobium chungbukense]
MPKLTERERLAEMEQRQRKMTEEIEQQRIAVRARYASIVTDLPVEDFTEKEFRDALQLMLKSGPATALQLLKAPSSRTG